MNNIEQRIVDLIDQHADELETLAMDLYAHPEQGYHEFRTAKIVSDFFKNLGLETKEQLAITGLKAEIGNGNGPNIALIGELDGIACPTHPFASEAGFSHACGHYAQIISILGAAIALKDPLVAEALDGTATLFALPAEEFLGAPTRNKVRESDGILCSAGKCELIRRGEFDDIDMAITNHSMLSQRDDDVDLRLGMNVCNGCIGKTVHIHGVAAHAGASPHEGRNALSAATLGLSALGMIRETFQEKDCIRVHPYMTRGGDTINTIPHLVTLDMMVRANNQAAIDYTSKRVDDCFKGAAMSIGCTAEIINTQGYMPCPERTPEQILIDTASLLGEQYKVAPITPGLCVTASTDVGDLFAIMPVLNYGFGGSAGALHSKDYQITKPNVAHIMPAKMMALLTYRLLRDHAQEAKKIIDDYQAPHTLASYHDYINSFQKN